MRSIQYQADKWWEKRQMSIKGLVVDPITNYPSLHHKNCTEDRKENYWWDLGSERVKNDERIATIILPELFEHKKTPRLISSFCWIFNHSFSLR